MLSVDDMLSGHKRRLFLDRVEFLTLIKIESLCEVIYKESLKLKKLSPPSFTSAEFLTSELTEWVSRQLLPLVYRHLMCHDFSVYLH